MPSAPAAASTGLTTTATGSSTTSPASVHQRNVGRRVTPRPSHASR